MSEKDMTMPVPALTLTPSGEEKAIKEAPTVAPVTDLGESQLTPQERQMVEEFSKKIDITDAGQVLQYGSAAQRNIASFSESALARVRTQDMGEAGDMIAKLVIELRGFDADGADKGGIAGWFRGTGNKIAAMKARYDKVEANIDKIVAQLEDHQIKLLKDIALLEKMYDLNVIYFKELSMYILAGKKKLEVVRSTELASLLEKARATNDPMVAQQANDYAAMCDRFEKKLHDLELTRMVSIQMAPEIRMIQANDSLLVEKITSSINNTIPLWKSQMVLALSMNNAQTAMKAQREVTEITNQLLRKNADALKQGTLETARESERGIIDIETLQHTNQQLISTLDEVMRIQEEGRDKRRAAEVELQRIEGELRSKVLELRAPKDA